jgi:hypothetical protein|tara:strand:+ start:90 stop:269 length:180 start_codon:yes stop_codon:yes gene_type:complete
MEFYVDDWVIPKGTRDIITVEAIERYGDVVVHYTSDRKAYPREQLQSLTDVYLKEKTNT